MLRTSPGPASLLSRDFLSQLVDLIKDPNLDKKKLRSLLVEFVEDKGKLGELYNSLRSLDKEEPEKFISTVFEQLGFRFEPKFEPRTVSSRKVSLVIDYIKQRFRESESTDVDVLKYFVGGAFKNFIAINHGSKVKSCIDMDEGATISKDEIDEVVKTVFKNLDYEIQDIPPEEVEFVEERVQHLKKSMGARYIGLSAGKLFNYLTECEQQMGNFSETYYGRFISICNSSGTGKTRAVLQLTTKNVPVVYVNLRPTDDSLNFPQRDKVIANLFDAALAKPTADEFRRSCVLIFLALFKELHAKFEELKKKHDRFSVMASAWNEVYTNCLWQPKQDTSERVIFFDRVNQIWENLMKKNPPFKECKKELETVYSQLSKLLSSQEKKDAPLLVIALDEVDVLTQEKDQYLPSHIIGQVIRSYSTAKVDGAKAWVVFTSTTNRIVHFAASAPARVHRSARVVKGDERLFAPFFQLQWDVYAKRKSMLHLRSVGSYDDVISFGRPLWKSVESLNPTVEKMSAYACTKLLCSRSMVEISQNAWLAVLCQRFSLEVMFDARGAVSFLDESIASHMRYLISTSEERTWRYTSYPSEPVLSNAAAQIMWDTRLGLGNALQILVNKIVAGFIDAGEFGELISRLLLLISRDLTAIHAYQISLTEPLKPPLRNYRKFPGYPHPKGYFPYLRPVRVLDVLDTLFGNKWSESCAEGPTIRSDFERAWMSASYWLTVTDEIGQHGVSADEFLERFFLRGVAIQCCHNQPLIDAVIPLLFLNEKDECDGMSSILIQVKNKLRKDKGALHAITAHHGSISLQTSKPYIAICFNLGVPEPKVANPTSKPKKSINATYPSKGNNVKCLRISSEGLKAKDFPVLLARTSVEEAFDQLIHYTLKEPTDTEGQHIKATASWGTSSSKLEWGDEILVAVRKRKLEDSGGEGREGELEESSDETRREKSM